jgi:hypothetical protein
MAWSSPIQMERPFQEHKVLQAMLSMDGDKVPGSNGFSIAFFRSCWAIVKDDLLLEFYNFHEHGIFKKSLNATFVALILEKTRQLEVGDFKAISMVGSVYKIMVKVLASRLKHVLGAVILNNHNPFIGWRQILDSILMANEFLDSRLR